MNSPLAQQLGIPTHLQQFEPTKQAALARVAAITPSTYARTRNALDGAVTGLSPYLTHGILSLNEVASAVAQKHRLSYEDKLVFELGWREFFHHAWESTPQPSDILKNMRPMNLWQGKYAEALPADIREGRTGVPCIDSAVRQLYATGYLHNHARMWIASYCIHFRKVHWRAGADWLYAHLLDGDLASNHLSWQWVASSFSSKPYLFNAENVGKYAPQSAFKAWVSRKTKIDDSYEALDEMARSSGDVGAEPGEHEGVQEPSMLDSTHEDFLKQISLLARIHTEKFATNSVVSLLQWRSTQTPDQTIELVHPWAMSERTTQGKPTLRIGIIHAPAHQKLPWSAKRWAFVLQRMQDIVDAVWIGDVGKLALVQGWPGRAKVISQATLHEGYRELLGRMTQLQPSPKLFAQPTKLCGSFTKFYEQAQRGERDFQRLLALAQQSQLL
jgi:deoxyribodipyrimidine photo-lyase